MGMSTSTTWAVVPITLSDLAIAGGAMAGGGGAGLDLDFLDSKVSAADP